jgi:hypothetical protein
LAPDSAPFLLYAGNHTAQDVSMQRQFEKDLAQLKCLAFRRYAKTEPLLRQLRGISKRLNEHVCARELWNLYQWLITPLSLWPFDIFTFAETVLLRIQSNKRLHGHQLLTLKVLADAPSCDQTKEIVAFEHSVEKGEYEILMKQSEKYQELSALLSKDPELQAAWKALKQEFDVKNFQNKKGVIRRSVCAERNFRPAWTGKIKTTKDRFRIAFDALCQRWQLWGMEHDKPLPLMLTANPTPHGILLMIPRLWSLDVRRDLNWQLVQKLHHAYGAHRQGPRLSKARIEMDEEAKAVAALWTEAGSAKLKGERKNQFVLEKMKKHPDTDPSWIKRRLKRGRQLSVK